MPFYPLPPDEPERLAALHRCDLLDTPPEPAFDEVASAAATVCLTPIALVSLVDERRTWFKARIGMEATETPRAVAFCTHAILGEEMLEIEDAAADERFAENPLVTSPPRIRFYAGVPIGTPEGHILGALCVIDRVPRRLTPDQAATLRALARQVSAQIALRRVARESEEARRVAEIERARLSGVLRAATECAIVSCDASGTITVFNEGAERMLGYRAAELVGRATPEIFHDPAEIAARAAELGMAPGLEVFMVVAQRGEADTREWTYVCKDGRRLPASLTITAMRDEAGEVVGFIGIARDVTQERQARLYEVEARARRAAEEAGRAKDEFLSVLSHELRTPLTAVLGWAHLLAARTDLPPDAARGIAVIERNAASQLRLVEDLLDLGRIVAGKVELRHDAVDLRGVVEAAAEATRLMADKGGLTLVVAVPPEAVVVEGDADRLQQIVANLLSNAIRFTPRGGHVTIGLEAIEGWARLVVADTGEGIAPEFLPQVFEPFRQAESSRSRTRGGLGLGLAIVKHLVDRHGGSVAVESEGRGRGATATVLLPRRAAVAEP